jgi:two-component system sensor histidine kinase DesK
MSADGLTMGGRGRLTGYPNPRARIAGTAFTGIWLFYLIGAFADLFSHHYSAPYIGAGLAILVVFCALYLVLVPNWPSPSFSRYKLPGVAALALLAAVFCLLFGRISAVSMWIFVSSASGLLVADRRWAARAVLGCFVCYTLFSWTSHIHGGDFLSNLLPVFIGFAMIGLRRQFELTAELSRARGEVAQLAANGERLRLARDMHDLTGQSLSTITLKSELAARLLGRLPASPDRDRARDEVEQVAAVSRQTLRDIREAISGYRRPTLAVEIITARAAMASAGIAARDDPELTLLSGTFDPDAEAALAWSLREAVTNVVRHSGATNCRITLTRRGQNLTLTVRDDGRGHAATDCPGTGPDATGADGTAPDRNGTGPIRIGSRPSGGQAPGTGLHGMAERLSAVGGSLELRPDAGVGFCLIASVPAALPVPSAPPTSTAPAASPASPASGGKLRATP